MGHVEVDMSWRFDATVGSDWHGQLWNLAVSEVIPLIAPAAWQRLRAGEGAKEPRIYDWA